MYENFQEIFLDMYYMHVAYFGGNFVQMGVHSNSGYFFAYCTYIGVSETVLPKSLRGSTRSVRNLPFFFLSNLCTDFINRSL